MTLTPLLALSISTALGAPSAEEIVVYGDDFARWDDTRWQLQSEIIHPTGLLLRGDTGPALVAEALQVRAVVHCHKDHKLSKQRYEVSCDFEDIALQAGSNDRGRTAADRNRMKTALDRVDDKLTGASIQLQVAADGRITNVDLEGVVSDNRSEQIHNEALRQVALVVMSGFHLRVPGGAAEGSFRESNSQLMHVPSSHGARGATRFAHDVVALDAGHTLVQGAGTGTVAFTIAAPRPDAFREPPIRDHGEVVVREVPFATLTEEQKQKTQPMEREPANDGHPDAGVWREQFSGGNVLDVEATFDLAATSVAVFDKSTGIMTERVWACQGTQTASSGLGLELAPFRHVGRIVMLDATEKPELGSTRPVAAPGADVEGLASWEPLEAPR